VEFPKSLLSQKAEGCAETPVLADSQRPLKNVTSFSSEKPENEGELLKIMFD
jgi:hypothetical protein